ncbi:hypothetical protein SAMN02910370_02784 [Lachnospiraceae bacterium XPB1003]|nr:hypothetical protein SAMN02910370_02784 [Lachnospiraceae bacterium XPB1003]
MKNKKIVSIILVIADIILLVLFVTIIPYIFRDIFGFDFVEYENWFGSIDDPIQYCFGAGSAEILFVIIRVVSFTIAQCKLLKGQSKVQMGVFILLHVVIAVLGMIYCFTFSDGANIIYNIRRLLD